MCANPRLLILAPTRAKRVYAGIEQAAGRDEPCIMHRNRTARQSALNRGASDCHRANSIQAMMRDRRQRLVRSEPRVDGGVHTRPSITVRGNL